MCGILAVLSRNTNLSEEAKLIIEKVLKRRGPDAESAEKIDLKNGWYLHLLSWVLHLRGSSPVSQPFTCSNGDILQWNGDIFGGVEVSEHGCDTEVLAAELSECGTDAEVRDVISKIEGPWSIVFYQKAAEKLWLGRDYFGRRSLLWRKSDGQFVLSSTAIRPETNEAPGWEEVPADGLYCVDLNLSEHGAVFELQFHPWTSITKDGSKLDALKSYDVKYKNTLLDGVGVCKLGTVIYPPIGHFICSTVSDTSERINVGTPMKHSISPSVHCNVVDETKSTDQAEVGMMPSDSMCSRGIHGTVMQSSILSSVYRNVIDESKSSDNAGTVVEYPGSTSSFDNVETFMQPFINNSTESKRRLDNAGSGVKSPVESKKSTHGARTERKPSNGFPTCNVDGDSIKTTDDLVEICDFKSMWDIVNKFLEILGNAVRKRVQSVPLRLESDASVGVLFSGGIDCTVIALLADKYVPENQPIDLLNVAFEQKVKLKNGAVASTNYDVPDRVTGSQSVCELRKLRPKRKWNFIEVNVTIEELRSKRKVTITNLTYPLSSVLDDSIGCAIWFAARGKGVVLENGRNRPYKCNAKVLLCGMGADEQLGGYSRHRSAFERGGWAGVEDEIGMEIERISARNLGRDNRIIADHEKDARMPYLDEKVVSFLNQTPISYKVDFKYRRGLGEKLLLRAAAHALGLRGAAILPKRAIQFGSRIAKAENKKEKASDICVRLTTQ